MADRKNQDPTAGDDDFDYTTADVGPRKPDRFDGPKDPTRSWWYRLSFGLAMGAAVVALVVGLVGVVLLGVGLWIIFG